MIDNNISMTYINRLQILGLFTGVKDPGVN